MKTKEQARDVFLESPEPWLSLTMDLSLFSSETSSCCTFIITYFDFCLEEGNTTSIKELLSNAFIFYGGSPLTTGVPHLQKGASSLPALSLRSTQKTN